jgi:hypothetical protein
MYFLFLIMPRVSSGGGGAMLARLEDFGIDWNVAWVVVAALGYAIVSSVLVYLRTNDKTRVAIITFVGLPTVLAILLILVNFSVGYIFIRCLFIFFAIVIPAALFYLFIATRRESLFNAYTANLDRVGLLRPRRLSPVSNGPVLLESESSRRRRIKSYLDRFAAGYGSLPLDFVEQFLNATAGDQAAKGLPKELSLSTGETTFEIKTVLPIIAATVLISLGWVTTLPLITLVPPALNSYGEPYGFQWFNTLVLPVFSPVNFAFLGAYFFSLQMLVRRFVRRDLGPNAYNAVSLRIILATLGVWVISQALGDTVKGEKFLVLAFAIGAFPDIVWQFVGSAFKKLPGVGFVLPSLKTGIPLNVIDGLTVWHEVRFEEEDIENVPNLATADIVDLFLNTKFPPHRIIDWIDQAILLTHLGDDTLGANALEQTSYRELKKYGLRTATSFVQAWEIAKGLSNEPSLFKGFDAAFSDDRKHEFWAIAGAIRTNPNFPLVQAWRGIDPG